MNEKTTAFSIVLIVIAFLCIGCGTKEPAKPVTLELFTMSECPYGTGAEELAIKVKRELGDALDMIIIFILDEDDKGNLVSLHGSGEVYRDRVQVCVREHHPEDFPNFLLAWNTNPEKEYHSFAEFYDLNLNRLEECIKGRLGEELLRRDMAAARQRGAHVSPTFFIDGQRFDGHRSSRGIFEKICEIKKDDPAWQKRCEQIPHNLTYTDVLLEKGESPKTGGKAQAKGPGALLAGIEDEMPYQIITVTYPDSLTSVYPLIQAGLKKMLPNAKYEEHEYGSKESERIIRQYGIKWLPAFLIESKFKDSEVYKVMRGSFPKRKDRYLMDPTFFGANVIITRPLTEKTIDIYYKPFSEGVRKVLLQVIAILEEESYTKRATEYRLCPFVALDEKGDFLPDGGNPELEEALRLVVIARNHPEKLFDYLKQRADDISSSYWQDFVQAVGLDPDRIKREAEQEQIRSTLQEYSNVMMDMEVLTDIGFIKDNREILIVAGSDMFRKVIVRRLP